MKLPRRQGWIVFAAHTGAVSAALVAAWALRFDFSLPNAAVLLGALPPLAAARWGAMALSRMTHGYWRYSDLGDMKDLAKAVGLGSVFFFLAERMLLGVRSFPYSVYLIEAMLSFALLGGMRMAVRTFLQQRDARRLGKPVPVMVVGAGSAALLLLSAMKQTNQVAVGLVDDDPAKRKLKIGGVPVLGCIDQLPALVRRLAVAEILIAIPSATGAQMIHITGACRKAAIPFRAVPSLASLISGTLNIGELHDVNLDDLLGREPVLADATAEYCKIRGRVVMVTGAAGSIGSELCRRILLRKPAQLICLDQAETPLFHLQKSLDAHAGVEVVYVVADIADGQSMRYYLSRHGVEAIFHAAAYKHVPMTELNLVEGLKNNVFGLRDLVDTAEQCGCEDFLLISSDKAVNPSSFMGCTKRLGEMIVGARRPSGMRCVSVRFGNVLGSQGSVIPVFEEQLRTGSPITVTHPQMTRFFMTIPEAASLVLQAFSIGEHGDILVLDMGKPVRIVDLARTLIRVHGKSEREVNVVFTGMRPGEKLHEQLFYSSETPLATALPKVLRAKGQLPAWPTLSRLLNELSHVAATRNGDSIRAKVKQIVPEYEWVPALQPESAPRAAATAEPVLAPRFAALSAGLAGKSFAGVRDPY
ncbi:MAG: nucleoside-diphosphate sugar epimerase/dehydratase [Terracidiphilus sp.]